MKWGRFLLKTNMFSRALALLIDNLGIYALLIGIIISITKNTGNALAIGSFIFTTYIIIAPVIFKGYHFGKYMMGMKIVKDDYNNPTIINIIIREFSKLIYVIPVIGVILAVISNYMMNIREDGKSIHDIIAKTKVINI